MLSQTIEYALRAMTHLASLAPGTSESSEAIARSTKVPRGYLSKVMRGLAVAGLVHSQRGPSGGFTLARPAKDISLIDVINAVDPIKRITKCPLGNPAHLNLCPLHRRLDHAIEKIEHDFRRTSLAEILQSEPEAGPQCRQFAKVSVRRAK